MYVYYGDDYYPSLPLQVVRMANGLQVEDMSIHDGLGVMLGGSFIPTDLSGRVFINYRGREGTYNYISAGDVLGGRVAPGVFRDKVVLLGTSAMATYDQKVMPLSSNMPGVEKNATVIDNMLTPDFIRKSPGMIEMSVTMITALVLSTVLYRLTAIRGALFSVAMVSLYVLMASYFFIYLKA